MKGLKETLVSFTIGLATLLSLTYLRKTTSAERTQNDTQPTQFTGVPEDESMTLNWGLKEIGAYKAWRKSRGNRRITVAIIDTGCDTHHPALKENLWRNEGEQGIDEDGNSKATNGIDDDGNGFADDVHGWNFASNSPDVMDEHGHGTHIAGIIGAKQSGRLGSSGVAPDVSLMILKYYDSENTGMQNLNATIKAIRYAIRMGADIINYSGGGIIKSKEEEEMLAWAAAQGILVVAAAGNEGVNSDFFHFYPADYELPNVISVAATDRNGELIEMSNRGLVTVDVAAPGKNIHSTLPNGEYGYMTGTSQATAFVTGAAVLLMSHDDRFRDPALLIRHLAGHGRPLLTLKNKIRSGNQLDISSALDEADLEVAQVPAKRAPAQN